jgi:nitrate reductase NapAB chaperone NapD
MESLLLILVLGGVLGIVLVFKQQNSKGPDDKDTPSEGSEE